MKNVSRFVLLAAILNSCAKPTNGCYTYSSGTITTTTLVTFDASCSEGASSYKWNFGDGTETQETNALTITHTFATAGTYTVTLNAQRKDGVTIRKEKPTFTQTIVVQ